MTEQPVMKTVTLLNVYWRRRATKLHLHLPFSLSLSLCHEDHLICLCRSLSLPTALTESASFVDPELLLTGDLERGLSCTDVLGRERNRTETVKERILAGFKTIAVRIAGVYGGNRRKKRRQAKVIVQQDNLMELWQKIVFPVRRLWFAVSTRVKSRKNGGGLLKLHNDVQSCGYEDVQVMWEMLRRSESEVMASSIHPRKSKNRPFWRPIFVWSNHNSCVSSLATDRDYQKPS